VAETMPSMITTLNSVARREVRMNILGGTSGSG
jgi:hypothetical protein